MITMEQATALIKSNERQLDLEQQRSSRVAGSHKSIPEQIKQVASHVFNSLTTMRPGWKVGFSNAGQLDAKQVTAYKIQLLKAMEENGIDSLEKVEKGLKRLRAESGQFLPAIGEFVQACCDGQGDLNSAMYRRWKSEQRIASCTEQERLAAAKQGLSEIKNLLKGNVA